MYKLNQVWTNILVFTGRNHNSNFIFFFTRKSLLHNHKTKITSIYNHFYSIFTYYFYTSNLFGFALNHNYQFGWFCISLEINEAMFVKVNFSW